MDLRELQLLDTPFCMLSSSENPQFKESLPNPRIKAAIGVTQGQIFVFGGQTFPDGDSDTEPEWLNDLILMEHDSEDTFHVQYIEKKEPWPVARTGLDATTFISKKLSRSFLWRSTYRDFSPLWRHWQRRVTSE